MSQLINYIKYKLQLVRNLLLAVKEKLQPRIKPIIIPTFQLAFIFLLDNGGFGQGIKSLFDKWIGLGLDLIMKLVPALAVWHMFQLWRTAVKKWQVMQDHAAKTGATLDKESAWQVLTTDLRMQLAIPVFGLFIGVAYWLWPTAQGIVLSIGQEFEGLAVPTPGG